MLSKFILAAATACGLFVSSVNGHMVIYSPVPYGQDSLTNSPLENDGSDFPCKQRSGVYDITKMNEMPVGVPQTLAFMGGATHGGGSCQVSVTLDKEPTKDSEWKVIHSIVGGCPSNYSENLSQDANGKNSAIFQFSVPKGMPNGEYTLAWTWFNKIGNREMYMNCAPISVTGGSSNNDVYNSLPTMFVINMPREECATSEMEDFVFPDPGLYVETAQQTALGSKTSGSNCAAVTAKGAGKGSAGSPAQPTGGYGSAPAGSDAPSSGNGSDTGNAAPPGAQGSSPAPTAPPLYPFRGGSKGVVNGPGSDTKPITASQEASAPAGTPAAAPPTENSPSGSSAPPTYNTPSDSAAPSGNTTSSGDCSGGAVSCPNPGAVVCIGSSQWGLCDINNCAVPRELSAGTSCAAGVVSKRSAGHLRRHVHHVRSY
ncbi:unnamed protein product [Zymoseptoria tritici ST99CH_3D7]|uniref:Lytic polysaccharide monooxygenase n=2 Tax=Zymoseptoria tritici TaxID=1047171 RepID=F9XHM6_ZYMTI|nr:uncharacterized protein MYCGRDRAFT_46866 [Zymoseptoria tritici IPO323]EGP85006.1 hypothetical protein MYCGRDRAFT_46866 [Zymoseptoria tritici IPO323]SMQ53351.1 unnamed protein product [Zymoseptoria tritici ST99CH_3D7]